jgi:hypothetical protein
MHWTLKNIAELRGGWLLSDLAHVTTRVGSDARFAHAFFEVHGMPQVML